MDHVVHTATLFAITRNLTLKKIILILFLFCISSHGFADQPRQQWKFWSPGHLFLLKPTEQQVDTIWTDQGFYLSHKEVKWGVFNSITNHIKYEIPGPLSEKKAYLSWCGKYVVIVNDWPPEQVNDSLELIEIYKKGELIASYTLSNLLKCGYNVTSSVSHFSWAIGKIKVNFLTNSIRFKTNEFVDYRINVRNGKIEEAKVDEKIADDSILAYGKVFGNNGNYRMEVCHRVYGEVPESGVITFTSDYDFHGGWYYSVLVNNGKEERIRESRVDLHDLIYNACTYELEKISKEKGEEFRQFGFGNVNCK